jgi:hypothetical protein
MATMRAPSVRFRPSAFSGYGASFDVFSDDAPGGTSAAETQAQSAELTKLIAWAKGWPNSYFLDKGGNVYLVKTDRVDHTVQNGQLRTTSYPFAAGGYGLTTILRNLQSRGFRKGTSELLDAQRKGTLEELWDYEYESRKALAAKTKKKEEKKSSTSTAISTSTAAYVPTFTASTPATVAAATTATPAKKAKKKKKLPVPLYKQTWFPFAVGGVALFLLVGIGLAVRSSRRRAETTAGATA